MTRRSEVIYGYGWWEINLLACRGAWARQGLPRYIAAVQTQRWPIHIVWFNEKGQGWAASSVRPVPSQQVVWAEQLARGSFKGLVTSPPRPPGVGQGPHWNGAHFQKIFSFKQLKFPPGNPRLTWSGGAPQGPGAPRGLTGVLKGAKEKPPKGVGAKAGFKTLSG